MKRTLSLLITLVLSCAALYAGDVTKNHLLPGTPHGLSVSSAFKVNLHNGPLSVQTTVSEEISEYVVVRMTPSGVVSIGLDYDRMSRKLKSGNHNWTLTADVSISSLESLDVSGAVKINANDPFEVKDMKAEISGASRISGLSITGHEAGFDISGASKAEIKFHLDELELDISGASSTEMDGDADELSLDCSGASNAKVNGRFKKVESECSGASDIIMAGRTSDLETDCSGASHFTAEAMEADYVEVDASGASHVDVNVLKRVEIELSGASHFTYSAAAGVSEHQKSIGKGCSVRRK